MAASNTVTERSYNCTDVLTTARTHDDMAREGALKISAFDRALLGPALTMSIRGLRVDPKMCVEVSREVGTQAQELRSEMKKLAGFTWPKNSRSYKPPPIQLARALYDDMGAPRQRGKTGSDTVAEEALIKVVESPKSPPEAIKLAQIALKLTKLEGNRQVLAKGLGADGRMHCSWGIARTVTGRWNSAGDVFGAGANMHAFDRQMRKIFIPDDGYEFVDIDLSGADSNVVAYLCGSQWYIDAHAAGAVHVRVGNELWPGGPDGKSKWTKDNAKAIKLPFKPAWSWYDGFKRVQHAGNYMQSPPGLAKVMSMPLHEAKLRHAKYHSLIPELKTWHLEIERAVRQTHIITTPMGRTRQFLGRTWEDEALKEAVAHVPQSTVSDINKVILYRIWRDLDPTKAMILLEVHDSNLFQVKKGDTSTIKRALDLARVEVPVKGRTMCIPVECARGGRWAGASKDCPDGLEKFSA